MKICVQRKCSLYLLLCVCGLILGCKGKYPYQFESEVVVFSLLIANRPNPVIKLERSWEIDSHLPDEGLGVNDGEVFVGIGGDTVAYVNDRGRSGFWNPLDSFVVHPTAEYCLSVSVPGELEICAETIVPDTFTIIAPRQGDTLDARERLPMLIWGMNKNAAGYVVDICSRVDTSHVSILVGQKDTLFPILPFFLGGPGPYIMKVVAVDENYHGHCRQRGPDPHGGGDEEAGNGGGLSSGLGVFGSCVVESVQVYIRDQKE